MDSKDNKYIIVKFEDLPHPELNPFQCVPSKWIKDVNDKNAMAAFPSTNDQQEFFEPVKNCQFPDVGWTFYAVRVIAGAGQHRDAMDKLNIIREAYPIAKNDDKRNKRKLEETNQSTDKLSKLLATTAARRVLNQMSFSTPKPSTSFEQSDTNQVDLSNIEKPTTTNIGDKSKFADFMNNVNVLPDSESEGEENDDKSNNDVIRTITDLRQKLTGIMSYFDECERYINNNPLHPECTLQEDEGDLNALTGTPADAKEYSILKFTGPAPNVVELTPNTGVFVEELRVNHAIKNYENPKVFVTTLCEAIFTETALKCLFYSNLLKTHYCTLKVLFDYVQKTYIQVNSMGDKQYMEAYDLKLIKSHLQGCMRNKRAKKIKNNNVSFM